MIKISKIKALSCRTQGTSRKLILTLLMVCMASTLTARKITSEEARAKACAFWNKAVPTRSGLQVQSVSTATSAYYVFNDEEEGFVIISGDDNTPAVLGYSTTGTFSEDSMPDGLKNLLETYRLRIESIPASAAPANDTTDYFATDDFVGEKQLETNDWGQGAPFNKYTPNNYPTGCVATALGIVMAYYGHPTTGTGSHSYTWNDQTLSADFAQSTYDWDNMRASYTDSYSDAEAEAVATLMHDIGIATEMNYTEDGSGSSMKRALAALVNNFGYSDNIKTYTFLSVGEDNLWKEKLRQEIDADRPIIYTARNDSNEGHAYVVDGYKDNLFSINWGWNGKYNGFYQLGDILTDSTSTGYNEFNVGQYALFYVQPATTEEEDGAVLPQSPLSLMAWPLNGFTGFVANTADVKAGSSFNAIASNICNGGAPTFDGYAYVALVSEDGSVRELLDSVKIDLNYGYVEDVATIFTCKPTLNATVGDSLMLVSKATGSTVYRQIYTFDNTPATIPALGYEPATVDVTFDLGEGVTCEETKSDSIYKYNGKVIAGSSYYFNISVPAEAVRTVVRGNGEKLSPRSADNIALYAIGPLSDNYTIKVRAYTERDMIDPLTVAVSSPGALESELETYDLDAIRSIVLTGDVDQRDFAFLNESGISDIDMMGTQVVAYDDYPADIIPDLAFNFNEDLTRFVMPWGITGINYFAFSMTGLTEVTIPAGVTTIDIGAFFGCTSLADVTVLNPTPVAITDYEMEYTLRDSTEGTLHVPAGCAEAYRAAEGWKLFTNIVEDAEDIYVGISNVQTAGELPAVSVDGGVIRVEGTQGAAVYSMDGKCVGEGKETTVSPGLYIVRSGGKAIKVLAR